MIQARGLTKRYGPLVAVNDLSFEVLPGRVTGFLGPNGSGKSTTLRMVLGLDAPSSGSVTVNGRPYGQHRRPLREVGALLDAKAIHGGRSAYNHLLCLAQASGIPRRRVDEVLERVGMTSAAHKQAGSVFPRDGPAARDRRRAAGGPRGLALRRAGQRPRS